MINISDSDKNGESGFNENLLYSSLFNVILLFFVAGMTATVTLDNLKSKFRNKGILVGLGCQFFINPLIGLAVVNIVDLEPAEEVMVLVLMSSPGGTYSNLLCSFFNADLALSVAMSAISTLAAVAMLPLNTYLYIELLSGSKAKLDWRGLGVTIAAVELGVLLGVFLGRKYPGKKYQHRFNIFGNVSGLALLTLALLLSQSEESLFEKPARFWAGTCIPGIVAMVISLSLSTLLKLEKPERLSVAVETVYQNTSIPTAVAFSTFSLKEAKLIASIPVAYGFVQASLSLSILIGGWKAGWSFADPNERFCTTIVNTYQPYEKTDDDVETYVDKDEGTSSTKEIILAPLEDQL